MRPVAELLDADGITVGYAEIRGAETGYPELSWDAPTGCDVTIVAMVLTTIDGERLVVPIGRADGDGVVLELKAVPDADSRAEGTGHDER